MKQENEVLPNFSVEMLFGPFDNLVLEFCILQNIIYNFDIDLSKNTTLLRDSIRAKLFT